MRPRGGHKERTLRIIGGRWRGRRVVFPAGTDVRPTPDRVRETVFNWLAGRIGGAACLDLYAGSGMLGLEALSRGAASVCFVERDARLAAALRGHLAALGGEADVHEADAARFVARAPARAYDVVFVDPPYRVALAPILQGLEALVADDARVYVERPEDEGLPDVEGWQWVRQARAGRVRFGLLGAAG